MIALPVPMEMGVECYLAALDQESNAARRQNYASDQQASLASTVMTVVPVLYINLSTLREALQLVKAALRISIVTYP